MAGAFVNMLGEGILEAYSAGSRPAGKVDEKAVRVHEGGRIRFKAP